MNTTRLKLLGVLFMTIDHIGEFIPGTPVWLRWVGRLAYPLFAFCCVQGAIHTSNIKKYLFRLYVGNIIMTIIGAYYNFHYAENEMLRLSNNIFTTLFQLVLLVYVFDYAVHKKQGCKRIVVGYIIYQVVALMCMLVAEICLDNIWQISYIAINIFCNIFWHETTGCSLILLGLVMYLPYRKRKDKGKIEDVCHKKAAIYSIIYTAIISLIVFFDILSRVYFRMNMYLGRMVGDVFILLCGIMGMDSLELGTFTPFSYNNLLYGNYQWMMIFSYLFLFFYNGEKGKGNKYLFYIYYPVHIILLLWIGSVCFNR